MHDSDSMGADGMMSHSLYSRSQLEVSASTHIRIYMNNEVALHWEWPGRVCEVIKSCMEFLYTHKLLYADTLPSHPPLRYKYTHTHHVVRSSRESVVNTGTMSAACRAQHSLHVKLQPGLVRLPISCMPDIADMCAV